MLTIHNLRFLDYGPFSFSINNNTAISIQGESGAGKSLLLRAIADLEQHDGAIELHNCPQNSMPAPEWRKKIGYLPADTYFWASTVEEHLESTDLPFLQQAIHTLRLAPLLSQPIINLSSGEKQRIALLRFFANEPKALLLDEPTSHLDKETMLAAESLILDYQQSQNCPLMLVSHDEQQRKRLTQQHYRLHDKSLQEINLCM